ncbi:SET domain-containing protein [Roseateles amylovorans]|uniref:SET domain-containing protein n=1 Tax=Roseateles amylovorans TaxID=2978473 RepID=A0ABY6B4Z5_9BURK|nr:SET domain-containing protein [Roseateles amylovorans]UXH80260.1 SET domain-containing protein [Roseateles amylovorans]
MALTYDNTHQFVPVTLRRSRIDGFGVFADGAIGALTRLGLLTGESITVAEARRRAQGGRRLMLVELSPARAIDASRSQDAMRFTNHSCVPNARIQVEDGEISFHAVRDIASGEEITVDYGQTHHEGRLACRCRASGCRGAL